MANQNILQRAQVKGTTQAIKSYAGIDGQLIVNMTTGDLHIMSGVAGSNKVLPCKQTVSQMIQTQAPAPDLSEYLTKTAASNAYLGKTDASKTYLSKAAASDNYLGKTAKAQSAKTADAVAWDNVSGKPGTFPPSAHNHSTAQITGLDAALSEKLGKTQKAQSAKTADAVAWDNVSGKPTIPAIPRIYVVETWGSTNSKYRVWSDGFVEQWGLFYPKNEQDGTVSFPRPFSTTDYIFVVAPNDAGTTMQPFGWGIRRKTTSSIYSYITGVANSMWYAAGY